MDDQISFLDWALSRHTSGLVVDIGAATGDFTAALMRSHPHMEWLLIEPTTNVCAGLRRRFALTQNVVVEEMALGCSQAAGQLNCYDDITQNSLLPQLDGTSSQIPIQIDTLDHVLSRHQQLPPPILIKIDTQGYDFQVLKGAMMTLRQHRPLVQVEMITVPLYEGQCSPADLFALFADLGYTLADMLMQHHIKVSGRLAFMDAIFAPGELHLDPRGPFDCRDSRLLRDQIAIFSQAAEERLVLVKRLHDECQQRAQLITELHARIADGERGAPTTG